MNFDSVYSVDDMLAQLPPPMASAIKQILMYSETVPQNASPEEIIGSMVEQTASSVAGKVDLSGTIASPFFFICIGVCILIYFLTKVYAEYKVSKAPVLNNSRYSPIGTYIASYVYNYDDIKIGSMRDDIDNIYTKCQKKYNKKEILRQRKDEILEDRRTYKVTSFTKVAVFVGAMLFFAAVAIGGIYVGLVFKGMVLLIAQLFIIKTTYMFIFPCRTDAYEFIQVREFKRMVENYELEKLDALL